MKRCAVIILCLLTLCMYGSPAHAVGNLPRMPCLRRTLNVCSACTLRAGPGENYPAAGRAFPADSFTVLGSRCDDNGLTWFAVRYGSKCAWIKRTAAVIKNTYTAIAHRDFSSGGVPVIYLSPSNQTLNRYAAGDTDECEQMTRIAYALRDYLERTYVCTVYIGAQDTPISRGGRPTEAYRKNADLYLALHSNAHGTLVCSGAQGYYFPGCAQSRLLAANLCAAMRDISPFASTVTPLNDGMLLLGGTGYAEVREPGSLGMISLLFELEFHDNADTAAWIIESTDAIAAAIGDGIAKTIGMRAKNDEPG